MDEDEDDVSLANDPVELCLLPVGAWQVFGVWGRIVIGGNDKGSEHFAVQFICLAMCTDLNRSTREEFWEEDGLVVLHRLAMRKQAL
ncbi:hypothetical protein [Vitiosangium sp. GDMCC 1.1324]|uniref:hypothetical protein n=1 Tax=Vitiosangium sp. (strain GDMCC 1.1324) TaxID=2138576 RepID=UPI000D3A54FD|nr:hypothetical protein [Vitiosangium sp. GDMCC 1.1324]PTL84563.1 hypothetical protein DAT35_05670 [Vitiosangium sp. GDMCC 1.1324]